MDAAAIVTLIGTAIAVLAIAVYLTIVAYKLHKTSFMVGTVLIGVRSIAQQTEPVGQVVKGIAEDVNAIESALAGLVAPTELTESDEAVRSRRRKALRAR